MKLPSGYLVQWGGQLENLDRARRRLAIILPITIAIMVREGLVMLLDVEVVP